MGLKTITTPHLLCFVLIFFSLESGWSGGKGKHYHPSDTPAHSHWTAPVGAADRKKPVCKTKESFERGKMPLEGNCAVCPGLRGKGGGPSATILETKPTDLPKMIGIHSDGDMPFWKEGFHEIQVCDQENFIGVMGQKAPPS